MKSWGFFILASLLVPFTARSQDLSIVDVRRNITLSDEDVVYKDFYINGGEGSGLKKNLVVTAVRKIQVRDSSGSQSYGEIQVPVGQLRVIAVFDKVAVAREYKLLSRDELPMIEQIGLMSGDRVDLKGSFIDNTKPVYKRKTAAVISPKEVPLIAVVTAPASSTVASTAPATAPAAPPASHKVEKTAETSAPKAQ